MINVEDIVNGIAIKLDTLHNGDITIYTDEIPQGFVKPSYGILFVSLLEKRYIEGRWMVSCQFDIQYFTDKGRVDASNQALKTSNALRMIELVDGTLMRGFDITGEFVDGVAHSLVTYNFFVLERDLETFMQSLSQRYKVRG